MSGLVSVDQQAIVCTCDECEGRGRFADVFSDEALEFCAVSETATTRKSDGR